MSERVQVHSLETKIATVATKRMHALKTFEGATVTVHSSTGAKSKEKLSEIRTASEAARLGVALPISHKAGRTQNHFGFSSLGLVQRTRVLSIGAQHAAVWVGKSVERDCGSRYLLSHPSDGPVTRRKARQLL